MASLLKTRLSMPESGSNDTAFVDKVRRFLTQSLTPELRAAGRATIGIHSDISACRVWHRILFAREWAAPAWPMAYGGTGWSARQRFLFERECAEHDAPVLFASGLRALGPLIIAIGSEDQKRRYLAPILDGRDLWCQGFSEAGAGSDLAALSMEARRERSGYRVTGRKLWTTGAQHANRMFLLVRTGRGEKPSQGITFLLLDMDSPGLSVRPILSLDGECEFNEVAFDSVHIPFENRIGAENEGWAAAKLLMRFARGNNTTAAHLRRALRRLCELPVAEPGRLASLEIAVANYEALELELLSIGRLDGSDEQASSLLKTAATELNQRITEFGIESAAYQAFAERASFARRYFATRAASIYSGTNEIHRNVLARKLLAG